MMRKMLIGTVVTVAMLAATAGVLYAFGTPQAPVGSPASSAAGVPGQAPRTTTGAPADPSANGSPMGGGEVVDGEVPAPDPRSPLAIQIPGCRCHSDDPQLVAEHANYRMNQCAGCHSGKTPTGQ